jgi:hypothetical protein
VVTNVQWASGDHESRERQAKDGLAGFLHEQGYGVQKFALPNGRTGFSCAPAGTGGDEGNDPLTVRPFGGGKVHRTFPCFRLTPEGEGK